jgi:hypothetical protein
MSHLDKLLSEYKQCFKVSTVQLFHTTDCTAYRGRKCVIHHDLLNSNGTACILKKGHKKMNDERMFLCHLAIELVPSKMQCITEPF